MRIFASSRISISRAPSRKRAFLRGHGFASSGATLGGLALSALLLAGCMSSRREEELQKNMRGLELKFAELEKQILMRDRNIDAVKNTTEDANRKVQSTKSDMDELRRQLSLTQGAIDELRVKMTRLQEGATAKSPVHEETVSPRSAENDEQLALLERRVARLEIALGAHNENQGAGTGKDKPKAPAVKYKSAADVSKVLSAAYVARDYKKVVALATQLLATQPPADQQEIALELRAEAYFQQQDYDKAALDFAEFLERFPKSERRPRALLLCGDSFVYLKQLKPAKSYYSECVKNFPDREECKASKERLDKLGV